MRQRACLGKLHWTDPTKSKFCFWSEKPRCQRVWHLLGHRLGGRPRRLHFRTTNDLQIYEYPCHQVSELYNEGTTNEGLEVVEGLRGVSFDLETAGSKKITLRVLRINRESYWSIRYSLFVVLERGPSQSSQVKKFREVIFWPIDGRVKVNYWVTPISSPGSKEASIVKSEGCKVSVAVFKRRAAEIECVFQNGQLRLIVLSQGEESDGKIQFWLYFGVVNLWGFRKIVSSWLKLTLIVGYESLCDCPVVVCWLLINFRETNSFLKVKLF